MIAFMGARMSAEMLDRRSNARSRKGTQMALHRRKHSVRQSSRGVRGPLAKLASLNSPERVQAWLGYNATELGKHLQRVLKLDAPIGKQRISEWNAGANMPVEITAGYGKLVANALTFRFHFNVATTLEVNSPWHITAWRECLGCDQWFLFRHPRQKYCSQCRGTRHLHCTERSGGAA